MTPDRNRGRLLILDDEVLVGTTICAMSKHLGFEALSVTEANAFLKALAAWKPTHIVLDLMMPNVDGIEMLRHLAERKCSAPIIIASGIGTRVVDAARRTASELGLHVLGSLPKPFSIAKFESLFAPATAEPSRGRQGALEKIPSPEIAISKAAIAAALDAHQFVVHYQPKIACASGALVGFEALVRWNHPRAGLVMPDQFLPVAERSGLIHRLTTQVFENALTWLAASFPTGDLALSLNLSATELGDPDLAGWIVRECDNHEIATQRIILEITETAAVDPSIVALELLTRFRLKGIHLSIDDFGVGYSSLAQLARLPFSELKIDKLFVMSGQASEESRKIIMAIVGLAHALGLQVTAEGVEDEWALGFLREIGCDLAQGYYIARPMDGPATLDWALCRP